MAILSLVIGTKSSLETEDRKVLGMLDILYENIAIYPLIKTHSNVFKAQCC